MVKRDPRCGSFSASSATFLSSAASSNNINSCAVCPAAESSAALLAIGLTITYISLKLSSFLASHIHLQRGDEGLLRDVDLAELAHALLAFLLLVQQLALAGRVAAIALGGDVLAEGAHGFPGDDLAADRGLDRNLEHVRRDQLLELLHHGAAAVLGAGAVNQHGERVDRLGIDQDLHLDEIGGLVVGEMVVERGIA